uniref:SDR family NAD(P)-dependent oxidoreductase n=1 Tax=Mycolicibacterium obuense TaxID=1807 RepID=UPI003F588B1F
MSELDLGLKVASRRLLWRMGFTTRVDVPLRAFVPPSASRRGARYETFTDLDVLGIAVAPGFALRSVISDCKTTQRGSTERMFWVRGVSDFFAADDAWMVRTGGVTAASRQLAARLGISVLEPTDLARLEEFHPVDLTQLGLHLRSPMLLTRNVLPGMLERDRGHIVVISSMSGKIPLQVKAPYAAAKAGSIAFCHSLRRELAKTNVAVSVITPGVVSGQGQAARALAGTTVRVPKSLGSVTVDEVATAVVATLDNRAAEVAVQPRFPLLLNALQAAAPAVADRVLAASGIGDFWAAVARQDGRA